MDKETKRIILEKAYETIKGNYRWLKKLKENDIESFILMRRDTMQEMLGISDFLHDLDIISCKQRSRLDKIIIHKFNIL